MATLTVTRALALVQRVLEEAADQSVPVAVVVVDPGGHPLASARSDSVGPVAADFARRKAVASLTFAAPTSALAEQFGQDPLLVNAFTAHPEVLVLPGGFPIVDDGACVGALGIAGGHYRQDQAIGQAALG